MSLITSLDGSLSKSAFESLDHWQFGQAFLVANKNKYPKERLVTLATMFVYAEFMGCIYPKPIMDLIKYLSKDFVNDLRTKLYRNAHLINETDSSAAEESVQAITSISDNNQLFTEGMYVTQLESNYIKPGFMLIVSQSQSHKGPFGILQLSCSVSKIKMPFIKYKCLDVNDFQAKLYIQRKLIAIGTGTTKKKARLHASRIACNILKEMCFTIVEKEFATESNCTLTDIANDLQYNNGSVMQSMPKIENYNKLPEDNIGSKILKKMGWKEGDGLGKYNQGCKTPIEIIKLQKRVGLGVKSCETEVITLKTVDMKEIKQKLNEFNKSPNKKLTFTNKLPKRDRENIYKVCLRFNLRAQNYGQSAMKSVIIYKILDTYSDIFNDLIICKDLKNDSYILEPPMNENFMIHAKS